MGRHRIALTLEETEMAKAKTDQAKSPRAVAVVQGLIDLKTRELDKLRKELKRAEQRDRDKGRETLLSAMGKVEIPEMSPGDAKAIAAAMAKLATPLQHMPGDDAHPAILAGEAARADAAAATIRAQILIAPIL